MGRFDLRKLKARLAEATDGFTRGQKAMMGLALGAVLVGMFWFTRSQGGQSMSALYSNLDAADASSIIEQLEAQGVGYELADQGTSIMVPSEDVYRLRLAMQAEGLPAGGEGWSLIDNEGITASQFRQRVDFQRALSGELARTIEAMDDVHTAKVTLVVPADDVFSDDSQKASASVLVKPEATDALSNETVRSIANLVASAVPELTTDAITITDTAGRSLWFPGKESIDASGTENASQRASEEARISTKVQEQLDKVVGPGKSQVTVAAEMNFDQTRAQTEQYSSPGQNGEPPLPISSSQETETYTGGATGVTGVLGADGQPLVPGGVTGVDGTGASYNKSKEVADWALNRQVTDTKVAPGQIERLSMSVVVDEATVSATDIERIRTLVTNAAGLDVERGDTLSVERMPFDTSAADAAAAALAEGQSSASSTGDLARGLGVAALVLVALFVAWRSLRKRYQPVTEVIDLRELEGVHTAELPESDDLLELGAGDEEWEFDESELDGLDDELAELTEAEELAQAEVDALAAMIDEDPWNLMYDPPASARMVQELEAELNDLVDNQSEDVAMLLRSWLGDRREAAR